MARHSERKCGWIFVLVLKFGHDTRFESWRNISYMPPLGHQKIEKWLGQFFQCKCDFAESGEMWKKKRAKSGLIGLFRTGYHVTFWTILFCIRMQHVCTLMQVCKYTCEYLSTMCACAQLTHVHECTYVYILVHHVRLRATYAHALVYVCVYTCPPCALARMCIECTNTCTVIYMYTVRKHTCCIYVHQHARKCTRIK